MEKQYGHYISGLHLANASEYIPEVGDGLVTRVLKIYYSCVKQAIGVEFESKFTRGRPIILCISYRGKLVQVSRYELATIIALLPEFEQEFNQKLSVYQIYKIFADKTKQICLHRDVDPVVLSNEAPYDVSFSRLHPDVDLGTEEIQSAWNSVESFHTEVSNMEMCRKTFQERLDAPLSEVAVNRS